MNLGVDIGGTWMRVALADGVTIIRRGRVNSSRPFAPAPALRRLLKKWGNPRVERLVVGSTGVWAPAQRAALKRELRGLARRVVAVSDVELAHKAAFAGGGGVLIIAGTGSIALARAARGKMVRAGGLGPVLGDEGSGFWLGKLALAQHPRWFARGLALRLAHDPQVVRKTAALAKRALRLAARGNEHAVNLRGHAAAALFKIASSAANAAGLKNPVVCAHGSLFSDAGLRKDFARSLPRGWKMIDPVFAPDVAAAVL